MTRHHRTRGFPSSKRNHPVKGVFTAPWSRCNTGLYRAVLPPRHGAQGPRLSRKNSMITESCLQTAQKPGRGEGGRTPEPCGGWWDRTHLCHRESVPRCSKLQARDVARTEPWGAASPGGTQGLSRDPSGAPRKMSGWTCQTGPLAWW